MARRKRLHLREPNNTGWARRPKNTNYPDRLLHCWTLVPCLLDEISYGTSDAKLYASMLVSVLVRDEPRLLRDFPGLFKEAGYTVQNGELLALDTK